MADFTGKKIKDTYHRVVQYHNGTLKDGLGFAISASVGSLSGSLSGSFEGHFSGSLTGSFSGTFDGATSSSFADRIAAQEAFSSSLDATYATDADLNLVSSSVDSINAATSSYALSANISGSFSNLSSSLASRISGNDTDISNLQSFSSSLDATYATDADLNLVSSSVDSLNAATSSYALAASISGSNTELSSSLSSRIASQESFSSSLDATYATDAEVSTAVLALNRDSSSYATTGSNTFANNQIISGTLDVTNTIYSKARVQVGTAHWTSLPLLYMKSNSTEMWIESDSDNSDGGDIVFHKSRGGSGAETAALDDDNLFRFTARAYLSGSTNQGSAIQFGDWGEPVGIVGTVVNPTSQSVGGKLDFRTQASGKYSAVPRLTIQADGHISASKAVSASAFYGDGSALTGIILPSDTGSFLTGADTGSFVVNSQTGSFLTGADTGSFVTNSQTGSFVVNSQTGSFLTGADTGSFVTNSQTGSFLTGADTGSFVTNSQTSSFASTGSNTFTGNQIVSASVLLTLQPSATSPSGVATGSLIVSGSPVQLYIFNGSGSTGWNRV